MQDDTAQSGAPARPFRAATAHPPSHAHGGRAASGFGARCGTLWCSVLDLALVLWVARIPFASLVLGMLLMAFVTQAQDVMVDVAMAGAPLAEQAGVSAALVGLLLGTFVLWAMPVHYAARLLLETDEGLAAKARHDPARRMAASGGAMGWMICLVPRVLGALTFASFAIGAWGAIGNLPTLADGSVVIAARAQLRLVAWVMLAGVPAFYVYTLLRARLTRLGALARLDQALGEALKPVFSRLGIAPRADDLTAELHATGRLALLFYGLLVVIVLAMSPLWLARELPLALAVPLIFGGWVPLLSYFASIGRRFHFPFVTALLVLGGVGVALFGDNHAVRTVAAEMAPAQRPSLDVAVRQWMTANGCAATPADCPRPIIVAAAGGASRAGFFTASVIGHFLDFERLKPGFSFVRKSGEKVVQAPRDDARFTEAEEAHLKGVDVPNRIFAISGVSGGSYGAAVVAAALAARARPDSPPPCPKGPQPYWFGGGVTTWADCLEALTGGDYLTASFFGLTFHDQVQVLLEDRAALLEQAWEARFADIVKAAEAAGGAPQGAPPQGAPSQDTAPKPSPQATTPPDPAERLAAPFLALGAARSPARWVPFLVLNGTSVTTGQRIITSDIAPLYAPAHRCPSGGKPDGCPIFTHAIDFHRLLEPGRDVALSTAATNSARFPIISPPGSILASATNIVDRIVDGGYFENYGALSALELAKAMVAVEPRLAPFVLVISNDPESTLTEERAMSGTLIPDAPDHMWLSGVFGPVDAIATVRSGRGRLAVAETERWLDGRFGARCPVNLAHIKVWPEARDGHCPVGDAKPGPTRDVSMSWWLSKPVQMNLREQVEPSNDRCNNDAAVKAVWAALVTPSSACVGAPRL